MLQETIDENRDKLKAFLNAEIKGWNDAIADPEGGAKLAVESTARTSSSTSPGQIEQLKAQNELIVTDDTKANGLFTLTDELRRPRSSRRSTRSASPITAEELFDLTPARRGLRREPRPDQGLSPIDGRIEPGARSTGDRRGGTADDGPMATRDPAAEPGGRDRARTSRA